MTSIEALLDPLTVDALLSHRSELLVSVGAPARFEALTSCARLFDAAQRSSTPIRALYSSRDGSPTVLTVPSGALDGALAAGGTLWWRSIDAIDADLSALCRAAERALGYPGAVRIDAFVAPDRGVVLAPTDATFVLVLQREGQTTWTCARAHSARSETIELCAGSLAAFPDHARTHGVCAGRSLVIAMIFEPIDFATLIEQILWRELEHRPEWRNVRPLLANGGLHGGPQRASMEAIDDRIDELVFILERWRANPYELLRDIAVNRWPSQDGLEHEQPEVDTLLTLAPSLLVLRNTPEDCLVLVDNAEIEANGPMARVLQSALAARELRASTLEVVGLGRSTIEASVRALAQAGILTPKVSPHAV